MIDIHREARLRELGVDSGSPSKTAHVLLSEIHSQLDLRRAVRAKLAELLLVHFDNSIIKHVAMLLHVHLVI